MSVKNAKNIARVDLLKNKKKHLNLKTENFRFPILFHYRSSKKNYINTIIWAHIFTNIAKSHHYIFNKIFIFTQHKMNK